MQYLQQPNLLLEALAYYGRKASGNTWEHMEQRLQQRRAGMSPVFSNSFAELRELTNRIDKALSACRSSAAANLSVFRNLEGFPFNTIGSSSPAFLLYYPMLDEFDGSPAPIADRVASLSPAQIARNIIDTLDIAGNLPDDEAISCNVFMNTVLSLSIPDSSKLSIMQIYNTYPAMAREVADILTPLLEILKQELPSLLLLTSDFAEEMSQLPPEKFFGHLTHLSPVSGACYQIRPFIFGMDTNLTFNEKGATVDIYCGFLREELMQMISGQPSLEDSVYSVYHLLGDRTRFDILCYLRDHLAYGQELSERFDLSRNTIHHHMNKLINAGLVRCTVDGNRVYYSLNQETIQNFLQSQQDLF